MTIQGPTGPTSPAGDNLGDSNQFPPYVDNITEYAAAMRSWSTKTGTSLGNAYLLNIANNFAALEQNPFFTSMPSGVFHEMQAYMNEELPNFVRSGTYPPGPRPYKYAMQMYVHAANTQTALSRAMDSGGSISANNLFAGTNNDFSFMNKFIGQWIGDLVLNQSYSSANNASPPWVPSGLTASSILDKTTLSGLFTDEAELENLFRDHGITSINPTHPEPQNAIIAEAVSDFYNNYMGLNFNPFSSAGSSNSLFEYLLDQNVYTPSAAAYSAMTQAIVSATEQASEMIAQGQTIPATTWSRFTDVLNLYKKLAPSENSVNMINFMENMITNISTTSPTMQAWFLQAMGQGIACTTQPPVPDGNFYTWVTMDFGSISSKQFFNSDPTLGFTPPMSDLSMILFNVMMNYGTTGTPTGTDLIDQLSTALNPTSSSFPMPGSAGPYPDISGIINESSSLYQLLIEFAENG